MRQDIKRVDGTPMSPEEYDRVERSLVRAMFRRKLKREPTEDEITDVISKTHETLECP